MALEPGAANLIVAFAVLSPRGKGIIEARGSKTDLEPFQGEEAKKKALDRSAQGLCSFGTEAVQVRVNYPCNGITSALVVSVT